MTHPTNICARYDGSEEAKEMIRLMNYFITHDLKLAGYNEQYYGKVQENEWNALFDSEVSVCTLISIPSMINILKSILNEKK